MFICRFFPLAFTVSALVPQLLSANQAVELSLPGELVEGAPAPKSNNAVLRLTEPAAKAMTFRLNASPKSELTLPAVVTVRKGATEAGFKIRAKDDRKVDGDIPVTIYTTGTGAAAGVSAARGVVVAVDNDPGPLALSLKLPATILEGGSISGSVNLNTPQARPVQVSLSGSAALSMPEKVTIPAGARGVTFSITAADNSDRDGTRTGTVVATPSIKLAAANGAISIRDNEVASYAFEGLKDIVNLSAPVDFSVSVYDIEGNAITALPPGMSFRLGLPDGSSVVLPDAAMTQTGPARFSGTLTLPLTAAAPLSLRVTDQSGGEGESAAFDTLRFIPMAAADLIWDEGHGRLLASVPEAAESDHANEVVAIDPETLEVTSSSATGLDPQKLAITSGGEYLYAALDENGSIAQIRLDDMALLTTFDVGRSEGFSPRVLKVDDMETVAGQPEMLVVSRCDRGIVPRHQGVAVYDHGIARPVKTPGHTGSNVIEPSPDPTVFYGLNTESTEFGFRRMKIDANGITITDLTQNLVSRSDLDIHTGGGSQVFTTDGRVIDGDYSEAAGDLKAFGLVQPVLAENRVYFLESDDTGYGGGQVRQLSAYDLTNGVKIATRTLPDLDLKSFDLGSLVRCGSSGVAFHTTNSIGIVSTTRLAPSQPSADLAVSLDSPAAPVVGAPMTYTVRVSNHSANPAPGTVVSLSVPGDETILSARMLDVAAGTQISGAKAYASIGTLAAGATATLQVSVTSPSAGRAEVKASASSLALDPDISNNVVTRVLGIVFRSQANSVNRVALDVSNLISDPGRGVLWATVRDGEKAPYNCSLVSIDPTTGSISDPVPLLATAGEGVMALSANGRYLYVGLSGDSALQRFDLSSSPLTSLRIPLHTSWGAPDYANDLEIMDGDGTSVMVAGTDSHAPAIYDGTVLRPVQPRTYYADVIERTATPGLFIGYGGSSSDFLLSFLQTGPDGVTVQSSLSTDLGFYTDIIVNGNRILTSKGQILNADTLTSIRHLNGSGLPLLDTAAGRAYLVSGGTMVAFNVNTGALMGAIPMNVGQGIKAIQWGSDGFAATGDNGFVSIARWTPGSAVTVGR